MSDFSMLYALLGGVLIGLAAGGLLFLNGRVAGISGIVGGILQPLAGDTLWRLMFVGGLVAGGFLLQLVHPASMPAEYAVSSSKGWALVPVAGLLVGFGARLGGGCTSGHGVCGVGRFSPRSVVATAVFMAAGIAAVWLTARIGG